MTKLRFASRKSVLALAQTQLVMDAVTAAHPDISPELMPLVTTGDVNMKPFSEASDKFGIKGLFTQELEEALLDRRADVAVHSLKDVPAVQDEHLPLIAWFHRDDPRDVLVVRDGVTRIKKIGCSSARRRLQVLALYPNATVEPVRGNVGTRLRHLDEGNFDALVLAAAGLKRLGLGSRVSRFFAVDEIVPAPGQAIIAVQGRAGHEYDSWLDAVADPVSRDCAAAERAFSSALGGGCASPAGACARIHGSEMELTGFFADEARGRSARGRLTGSRERARQIGEDLAEKILREMR